MPTNKEIVDTVKKAISAVDVWKTEKQKTYLLEYLYPVMSDLIKLDFEEKREILYKAMKLSRKAYINLLTKEMQVSLNDDKLKMWRALENCYDNAYKIFIIEKKDNWNDFFQEQYFFEQVLLAGRTFYIGDKEKELCKKLENAVAKKTDVSYWLSKEETTGLSKLSYMLKKHNLFGDFNASIMNIKPGWLGQDHYSIINHNNENKNSDKFTINEEKIDWNSILKKDEEYPEEAKVVIRTILENLWLQKTEDGKYIFESDKVDFIYLPDMWLFREKHFQYDIFTTDEKTKLLQKTLNHRNSFTYIKSAKNEGIFTRMVLKVCMEDPNVKWHEINFTEDAWNALKISEDDKFVNNLIIKSRLEDKLVCKNIPDKKTKI